MSRTRPSPRPQRTAAPPAASRRPWRWVCVTLIAVAAVALAVMIQARQKSGPPGSPANLSAGTVTMQAPAPFLDFTIVRTLPHDRTAFTQGLLYRDGYLYESTGLHGQSSLRKVELETGRVVQEVRVPAPHFAEGLACAGNRLFQLTWQTKTGFVYDLESFKSIGTFGYEGEGWGLAYDGSRLIMSDGSADLRFLDATSQKEAGRVTVTDGGQPVSNLNELEVIRGEVFANVWMTDHIISIAPDSGRVTGRLNLRGLLTADDVRQQVDVMNGIAYDAAGDRLFVTGKWWPKLFEIKLGRK